MARIPMAIVLLAFFGLIASGPAAGSPVDAERRLALVIGNFGYRDAPPRNAGNDADDMADAPRALDFHVTLVKDADRDAMWQAIARFGDALPEVGVGLLYYSGHGIQVDGKNYLLPLGASFDSKANPRLTGKRLQLNTPFPRNPIVDFRNTALQRVAMLV